MLENEVILQNFFFFAVFLGTLFFERRPKYLKNGKSYAYDFFFFIFLFFCIKNCNMDRLDLARFASVSIQLCWNI